MKRFLTGVAALALPLASSSVLVLSPSVDAVPPTACGETVAPKTFTQPTDVSISAGAAATYTSTIVVSGAGSSLADLDVQTFLAHTAPDNLDVTITSPQGTVVTLTTDNGGSYDNAYNGTVWDDQADPGGQVPYPSNQNLVTDRDHSTIGQVAATLVPEEGLAAFNGENPNGSWTLTISDDTAGDGGTLTDWSLTVTATPTAPILVWAPSAENTTDIPIPIGVTGTVFSSIEVSGAAPYLYDVSVGTDLQHSANGEVDMTLTSPEGTSVTLTTDNGGELDNVFNGTVWATSVDPDGQVPYTSNDGLATDHTYANLVTANPLVPEESLGAFIGEDPNGTWTLRVYDDTASGSGGSLDGWSLGLGGVTCPVVDKSVTGAQVTTKKAKVKALSSFKVKSEVRATAEALIVAVKGKVKATLASGKKATYKLAPLTRPAALNGRARLKQLMTGSTSQNAAARAVMLQALKAKRPVIVKLKFTITDAAGNKQVVRRTVKVKKG